MPRVAALVMEHFLQKINYKYNIRGWLTHINELNHLDAHPGQFDDLFAFKINYNTVDNSLNDKIKPLYNGNISETFWQTASDGHIRKYGYKYDQINRLQEAIFQRPGFSPLEYNSYNESLWYDKNGNITRLYRTGEVEDAMEYLEIDDLTYLYDDVNKNQLRIVDDSTNNPKGFKDDDTDPDPLAIDDTIDYDYDDYGNMISDTNKGISEITYNHLNLPIKIVLSNGIIEYLYNAAGVKVQKTVTLDSEIHTTDYQSGYQYKDGQLQFFPHAEGYVNVLEENYFNYVYHYTDHLGNIRVSYGIDPESFDLVILEENHYYPFGMKHANYNVGMRTYIRNNMGQIELPLVSEVSYKYKYNGKEWQDELSLNWYDYQARNYDPALGRWMNIDPLAEVSRRWSPYTYCYNNPIVFVDPDGMLATPSDDIYLNARNGEVLGVDADGNNGIVRVIDGVDWDDTVARNGGSTSGASTTELRNSSSVVTVNDAQIQSDINSANNETIGDQTKERQVYIGLSVNMDGAIPTAEVTSVRGPDGVDGLATITTNTRVLERDANGNVTQSKTTFANSGGLIPLGQVYTHNLIQQAGLQNIPGTSGLDASTSSSLNIPIFAVDSYTGNTTGGNAIHRVNPNGTATNNVGTTSSNTVGTDVLRHKIGL